MNRSRRIFLGLAAGAVAAPAVSRLGWAQNYPSRPIRMNVGFPPGIALIAGDISAMFGAGSIVPVIQSGKARALAASGAKRFALMPDLPTVNEVYPGYEVLIWHGLFAPVGVPQPIMDRLRAEVTEVLKQPDVIARLANSGSGEPYLTTAAEFDARIHGDNALYGKVIRSIGAKLD